MAILYPEVGMKGSLSALAPYDTVIRPRVRYECMAIESLAGILGAGQNAYELYYKPRNIDQTRFDQDVAANVKLITLQSYQGEYIKVPSSFLSGLPDPSGVAYRMFGLSVALHALPVGIDLSSLKQDIADLVKDHIGVTCDVQELVYGPVALLTDAQDTRVRAVRTAMITGAPSNKAALVALTQVNDELIQKLAILQNYIETHYVPA